LSRTLTRKLKKAEVDKAVRGKEGASDHAPVWITL
jgi:exodeoxyribonuclease-3